MEPYANRQGYKHLLSIDCFPLTWVITIIVNSVASLHSGGALGASQ